MSASFAPRPLIQFAQHSVLDLRQKQLAKFCYWEDFDQVLWVDPRSVFPDLAVFSLPSWDRMMLDAQPIPDYPAFLKPFDWPKNAQLDPWLKQIPRWVQDSCRLFPNQQLRLLHFCAKYPQLFELLDQSPVLAWRLVSHGLTEPEIVALLSGNRANIVQQLGWPGKEQTVKLLRNLRLRFVNTQIAQQIETCIIDPRRLDGLQSLPRINSMALALAAAFPQWIGSRLHRALAQLPCRPLQCQALVALLEDCVEFFTLTDQPQRLQQVGDCRYLSEVETLYRDALSQSFAHLPTPLFDQQALSFHPQRIEDSAMCLGLSMVTQQPWWLMDLADHSLSLVAWCDPSASPNAGPEQPNEPAIWVALVRLPSSGAVGQILKLRGRNQALAQAKQLSELHLWLAQQGNQNGVEQP
ncbi:MAG: hypothetical protein JXR44_01330 [Thiotrichales bacterium]|nr:hypothetical protein [Thiotrichales bacterium]